MWDVLVVWGVLQAPPVSYRGGLVFGFGLVEPVGGTTSPRARSRLRKAGEST
jgi:hypothetical protein